MTFSLGDRSRRNLNGVHPDLVKVVERAIEITEVDFTVIEGLRTKERQAQLFRDRFTKTMSSRHLTGHAVDIAPYPIDWEDKVRFARVAKAMKQAACELNVAIVWGGDWKNSWDMPHYQLDRKVYP